MEALGQVEVSVLHSPGLRLRNCLGPSPLGSGRNGWVLAGPGRGFPALAIQSQVSGARPSGPYNYRGGSCGPALEQG